MATAASAPAQPVAPSSSKPSNDAEEPASKKASGLEVKFVTKDDKILVVPREAAFRSIIMQYMFADCYDAQGVQCNEKPIPLTEIKYDTLVKVMEWCKHHMFDPAPSDSIHQGERDLVVTEWDEKFFQVDQQTLFDIILAANFLDIQHLLDIGCKTVADMIKGKSPEEIRKTFNIINDFTQAEEEQIRRENEWAEER